MKRVLVTGSRTWRRPDRINAVLDQILEIVGPFVLVHGDCPNGPDALADDWAGRHPEVVVERHPADWKMGKQAGFWRNQHMVNLGADLCIGFMRNNSPGTLHCTTAAICAGIKTRVYRYDHARVAS
jgi:hypothetical protein